MEVVVVPVVVGVVVNEVVVVEVVEIAGWIVVLVVVDACMVIAEVAGVVDGFVVVVEEVVVGEKVLGFGFLFDGRVKSNSFCTLSDGFRSSMATASAIYNIFLDVLLIISVFSSNFFISGLLPCFSK